MMSKPRSAPPVKCVMALQALTIAIDAKAIKASINQALHHLVSVSTAAITMLSATDEWVAK